MGFLRDRRDAREVERLSRLWEAPGAEALMEDLLKRRPGEVRTAALLAYARSERGDSGAALEAVEMARRGLSRGALATLKAEILLDGRKKAEARAVLDAARAAESSNVVLEGLLGVLDLEARGFQGARAGIDGLPPAAIWCRPVLSHLLLALEEEMGRRGKASPLPGGYHEARAALIRPCLEKELFRPFWSDRIADLISPPRDARRQTKRSRERAVRSALHEGDLKKAFEILGGWLKRAEGKRDSPLDDLHLAMEIAFVEGRFSEVQRLHGDWLKEGGEPEKQPYPTALAAYSLIALGKAARALEVLSPPLKASDPEADLLHLAAVAEIELARPFRASGALRRAVSGSDIALVRLAKEEAAWLDGLASPAVGKEEAPGSGAQ